MHPEYVGVFFGDVRVVVTRLGREKYDCSVIIGFSGSVNPDFAFIDVNHLKVIRTVFTVSTEIFLRYPIVAATVYCKLAFGKFVSVYICARILIHRRSIT